MQEAAESTEYLYRQAGSTWDGSVRVHAAVFRALAAVPAGSAVLEAGCRG
jgi:hypothetical protein